MPIQKLHLTTTLKAISLKACPSLALLAALSSPAWAERLDPTHSVIKDAEDIQVSANFPQEKTGDLYIAADVGGTLYFYGQQGWSTTPQPREYGQTYSGVKQLNLGNSSDIGAGMYPIYEVVTTPNSPDVYDTRNWVGGLGSLGQTLFQVKLPTQISGDFNGDGWADDDVNHDGYHDDDTNHDGFHDDDPNHTGYHADDLNHDGQHDGQHDGNPNSDGNSNSNGNSNSDSGSNSDSKPGDTSK